MTDSSSLAFAGCMDLVHFLLQGTVTSSHALAWQQNLCRVHLQHRDVFLRLECLIKWLFLDVCRRMDVNGIQTVQR